MWNIELQISYQSSGYDFTRMKALQRPETSQRGHRSSSANRNGRMIREGKWLEFHYQNTRVSRPAGEKMATN